jgi:hypothetical protein
MATTKYLGYTQGLTGGGAQDLDSISKSTLGGEDPTFVITTGAPREIFWYQYDTGSTASENSPSLIAPDNAASSAGRHFIAHPYRKQAIINCTGAKSLGGTDLGGHKTYTNYGASSSLIKLTLPVGSTGYKTSLVHMSCGKFSIVANTSQYFRQGTVQSAKGSKLESTRIGYTATITYVGNNLWIISSIEGTWNYDT